MATVYGTAIDPGGSTGDKKLNFKCCKTKINSVSVCINCGNGYHRTYLGRYKILKTIDEIRVICCLTSKEQPAETETS